MLESRSMARTIGVVTVARSDYGHLVPLLEAFRDRSGVALQVYVAGAHLSARFGRTVEVIEGAIDEQARHALTKLAHVHFPAAEAYARRILQMGEEPWRVHCVGAPGLDRFARLAAVPRAELARRIGLPLRRPTLLVTFH